MKLLNSYRIYTDYIWLKFNDGSISIISNLDHTGTTYYRDKIDSITGIRHTGIYLGVDQFNVQWWIHNHIDQGHVHLANNHDFSKNEIIKKYNCLYNFSKLEVIDKALHHAQLKTKYNALTFNCQTFVHDVTQGRRYSPAVSATIYLGIISAGLLLAVSSSSDNKNTP